MTYSARILRDAFGEGGNAEAYPGGLYDSVGRFLYVSLDKKF